MIDKIDISDRSENWHAHAKFNSKNILLLKHFGFIALFVDIDPHNDDMITSSFALVNESRSCFVANLFL